MFNKKIDDINLYDIKSLIKNKVMEGPNIEYKKQIDLKTDSGKAEFLKDISALTNTSGGDFFVGLEEKKGIPRNIAGINIDNLDIFQQTIENIIKDGLEPILVGVRFKFIECADQGFILIIRVPKSHNAPHRVKYNGSTKIVRHFYARNSSGVYELPIYEIKNHFIANKNIAEKSIKTAKSISNITKKCYYLMLIINMVNIKNVKYLHDSRA